MQKLIRALFHDRTWPGGLRQKLVDYARIGLLLGGALALVASIPLVAHGPAFYRARFGLGYPVIVLLYLVGGVLTSVTLAILEKWARSLLSYLVIGVIVALPASAMLALALARPQDPLSRVGFVTLGMAGIYGVIGALIAWGDT